MKFLKYLAVVALGLCSLVSPAKAQQMNPTVQDNFHRGNESPLADYGNWSVAPVHSGTAYYPAVVSSTLQASVAGDVDNSALWTGVTWGPDQFASITFDKGLEDFDCVKVRADLLHTTYYVLCAGITTPGTLQSTTTVTLSKEVTDVATTLKTFTLSSSDIFGLTGTITLEAQGTTITALYNNAVLGSVTDSSIASGVPGLDVLTAQNLSENTITLFQAGTMTATNSGVPCGQAGYGMYSAPIIQFTGDAGINQVSASGGYVTFYVGSTGKTPVVGQSFVVSNVLVGDTDDLNGIYIISSVGAPVSGWVPVTAPAKGGATLNISLTNLSPLGLFDEHIQFPTTIALTNNYVTVTVPNNFAPNQRVVIRDAVNSLYSGGVTIYSSSPTAFTYYLHHSNVASESETNNGATVSGTDYIAEFVTVEGQATGNLSCVTSNFQNEVTINSNSQKGSQYTPGNHGTYTAQVDIAGPCDGTDPLDICGGDMGGGVACADSGTCGGSNNYVGNDCPAEEGGMCIPEFQDEIAYTRYHIPQNEAPLETWTTNAFLFNYTWGLFLDFSDCSVPTTPPDLFFPATPWPFKVDGMPIWLQPPVSFFHVGYCHRFATAGPWTCWPFVQLSYPVGGAKNPNTAKCTKHP